VTLIKTAVTVRASKNADITAADNTKSRDRRIFDLNHWIILVKITNRISFIKNIADTINTNNKITSKFDLIS
tara:strand:- start:569 stop:784 length:216 start_codon:yes stop_codon:yes gene_type:complete